MTSGLQRGADLPSATGSVVRSRRGRTVTVTRDEFLTVRWNNRLSLGLGIPTLIYVGVALTTSAYSGRGGLIGLFVFGAFL